MFGKVPNFRQLFENDQQATPIVENKNLAETNVEPISCFLTEENSRGQSVIRSNIDKKCQTAMRKAQSPTDVFYLKINTMFCENVQFNLSLYSDDVLTNEERAVLDDHLAQCPLCRQKLADFQALRNNLRVLPRPEFSVEMLNKVRKTVAEELYTVETKPVFLFSDTVQNWVQMRLMPYSVGTVASLILGFSLLWTLFSGIPRVERNGGFMANDARNNSPIFIANADPERISDDFAADEFPELDLQISNAAPSVNPSGALIALTKSFVRGSMKDDEVVVVADVFGNGLAQIAEVVEPTNDWKTVNELDKALMNDPDFAPFIPAKADHRSETVRVIFKIQHVEVDTNNFGRY